MSNTERQRKFRDGHPGYFRKYHRRSEPVPVTPRPPRAVSPAPLPPAPAASPGAEPQAPSPADLSISALAA